MESYIFSADLGDIETVIISTSNDSRDRWTVVEYPDETSWVYPLLQINNLRDVVYIHQLDLSGFDSYMGINLTTTKFDTKFPLPEDIRNTVDSMTKASICNYNSKFDGIDSLGNLVKTDDEVTSKIFSLYDIKTNEDLIKVESANDIKGYIAIVVDSPIDSIDGNIAILDKDTKSVKFYNNINLFLNDIKNNNYIFVDHIIVESCYSNRNSAVQTYIEIILTELSTET